mgnify:CR=1 FL=1
MIKIFKFLSLLFFGLLEYHMTLEGTNTAIRMVLSEIVTAVTPTEHRLDHPSNLHVGEVASVTRELQRVDSCYINVLCHTNIH